MPEANVVPLSEIPDGTVLEIGAVNWDFVLQVSPAGRGVRAVPKKGPKYEGCQEAGFGCLLYWRNNYFRQSSTSNAGQLTAEGKRIVEASHSDLTAIGGVWGLVR